MAVCRRAVGPSRPRADPARCPDPTAAVLDIHTLADYCDSLLGASAFSDYCPNGLQVEGDRPVGRLVSGVTASQALIDAAIADGADAVLVHHGLFWKGDDLRLLGPKGRRVAALMRAGVSLLAYHLPLDAHPVLGNNRQLARVLGIDAPRPLADEPGGSLLWRGELGRQPSGAELAGEIAAALRRAPLHLAGREAPIRTIAWCTGAAQGYIEQAAALGVDAYLSGEVSEQTTHLARELGIDYFGAGHHATERYGVEALGAHLSTQFGLSHQFVDLPNPV